MRVGAVQGAVPVVNRAEQAVEIGRFGRPEMCVSERWRGLLELGAASCGHGDVSFERYHGLTLVVGHERFDTQVAGGLRIVLERRANMDQHATFRLPGGHPNAVRGEVDRAGSRKSDRAVDAPVVRDISFISRSDETAEHVIHAHCDHIYSTPLKGIGNIKLETGVPTDVLPDVATV